jgi:hypothetical protein
MYSQTGRRSPALASGSPYLHDGEGGFYSQTLLNRFYLLAMMGSVLLTGIFVIHYLNFSSAPLEDAAILMRYSVHLAQGHGVVWNINDKPVDGATDFLYMVVLALLVKAGLAVEIAARLVGIVSYLLTIVIVYVAVIKLHVASRWLALLSATYLAIGPALAYITAGFGTTFFALFACITWYLAYKLVEKGNSSITALLFAVSALLLGLIRPEGVLLAIFMLLAILYMRGVKNSRKIITYFFITFLFLGGAYFLWRWNYFGYPLPNPYYKKGGGLLYFSSLLGSFKTVLLFCGPFTLAFVLGIWSSKTFKPTIFLLIPTFGFTLIWILLSSEMNYLGRFQYTVLPLVLMSWTSLIRDFPQDLKLPQLKLLDRRSLLALLTVVGCICLVILYYPHTIDEQGKYFRDGNYDVALMLRGYGDKHYTMATSEAGLLPLYSNWRDIDTWGLNDQWIAHHGQITEAYLASVEPEIIVFHAPFSPVVPVRDAPIVNSNFKNWFPMLMVLKNYAESRSYILAAAFGTSPYNTFYYYVKRDFPDSTSIVERIRNTVYSSYSTGERCINYAQIN